MTRSSAILRDGVASVAAYARALGPDAAQSGDLVQFAVRQAAVGVAVEQLTRLAHAAGVEIDPPAETFPGTADALALLDREHRPFDVARVNLWLAEAGESAPDLASAVGALRGARRASVPRAGEASGLRWATWRWWWCAPAQVTTTLRPISTLVCAPAHPMARNGRRTVRTS